MKKDVPSFCKSKILVKTKFQTLLSVVLSLWKLDTFPKLSSCEKGKMFFLKKEKAKKTTILSLSA